MKRKFTFIRGLVVLLIVGLFAVGCSTKVVEEDENMESATLPEDFSEMVGSPSFDGSSIYLTYINKKGEYVTKKYYSHSTPNKIIWVKPESVEE